jgi:hypothetical protein
MTGRSFHQDIRGRDGSKNKIFISQTIEGGLGTGEVSGSSGKWDSLRIWIAPGLSLEYDDAPLKDLLVDQDGFSRVPLGTG